MNEIVNVGQRPGRKQRINTVIDLVLEKFSRENDPRIQFCIFVLENIEWQRLIDLVYQSGNLSNLNVQTYIWINYRFVKCQNTQIHHFYPITTFLPLTLFSEMINRSYYEINHVFDMRLSPTICNTYPSKSRFSPGEKLTLVITEHKLTVIPSPLSPFKMSDTWTYTSFVSCIRVKKVVSYWTELFNLRKKKILCNR